MVDVEEIIVVEEEDMVPMVEIMVEVAEDMELEEKEEMDMVLVVVAAEDMGLEVILEQMEVQLLEVEDIVTTGLLMLVLARFLVLHLEEMVFVLFNTMLL